MSNPWYLGGDGEVRGGGMCWGGGYKHIRNQQ